MKDKIYIFSGLGVDRRVFDNINFYDLDVEFVDWITPKKGETLPHYALRINQTIKAQKPILIGLSFGGILAIEISKIIQTKQIILIASAKTKFELPKFYQFIEKLQLIKVIPPSLLKQQNFITNWFFGIKGTSEKKLLKSILKDTDSKFLLWALSEILKWKNEVPPTNCIHIHGDSDKIIPIKNVTTDFIIKNAGHFLTVNRSHEIEKIIQQICH